ncbi:biotin/lipoyl-binding protein [OM182 bacterium]|nr:biotin/lipoyl-binding protein [OM182 bacterium]
MNKPLEKNCRKVTRLLIANRGEIARRINRSAQRMGLVTIAVYSEDDVNSPHVKECDFAVSLDGGTAHDTYLNQDKIINACLQTNADAIHPGYGFLSENSTFASRVVSEKIIWIGPSPDAIASMGDKLAARELMIEAGVPMLPAAKFNSETDLEDVSKEVGFPLLVKASAGGGGKGMRVVHAFDDLESAILGAQREALNAFGDETVFLEKWLPDCRHIEIQILGDQHGGLVHCFERECSIQRRHQKIIEEAPSPSLSEKIRARMGQMALTAARKISYFSAGTIEFLFDGHDFFFLEMNTRLQVEHPVTEAITGIDIVREQILIAQGSVLSFCQEDLKIAGHAIEARLYAEDPNNDFLPSPGKIKLWELPCGFSGIEMPDAYEGLRLDSGVETGCHVSVNYDPMMAKFIFHAATRHEAARGLAKALEKVKIFGVQTNRDFLVVTLRHEAFLNALTTTNFIEIHKSTLTREVGRDEYHNSVIALIMEVQARSRQKAKALRTITSGWRNSVMPLETLRIESAGYEEEVVEYALRRDGSFRVRFKDLDTSVFLRSREFGLVDIEVESLRAQFRLESDQDVFDDLVSWYVHGPKGSVVIRQLTQFPTCQSESIGGELHAPMPGTVVSVTVRAGDPVEKGQVLMVLEAMKMEHQISASAAGNVTNIFVDEGEQVANGHLLLQLEVGDS